MATGATVSTQDMRIALALAGDLATCRNAEELEAQFESVPRLIPADSVVISALRTAAGRLVVEAGDSDVYRPELLDAVSRHWREHPVMSGDLARAGHGARRLSDFTTREWRRHGLFYEFYRPLGMPRELSVQLSWGPAGSSCCLVLHRSGRDFSVRELLLLEQISPHLQAAWARVARETSLTRRLRVLERAVGDRELRSRLPPGSDENLVALTEHRESLSVEARLEQRLPITHREAEVLARLAHGHTNDGIAYELGISRHTVVRHIESIYMKLGTHTRAAATRAALGALYEPIVERATGAGPDRPQDS